VRGSVIDDVALARQCAALGVRLCLARGEHLGSVRMYDSLGAIWQGFGKNAFSFVTTDAGGGLITAATGVVAASLPALAWRGRGRKAWREIAMVYTSGVYGLLFWQRRFGAGSGAALLYPLSALVFQALAIDSALRLLGGRGVIWKGRLYSSAGGEPRPGEEERVRRRQGEVRP
jgi:hypothetical protein